MTETDEFWNRFLQSTGRSEDERCAGDLAFEAGGFVGDELVTLLLAGKKTAFFTSWASYAIDQEPLPVSGELYVVLDRGGKARCVVETQEVQVVPFNEVTWSMAEKEGEDENLGAWKSKKQEYLEDEGAVLGFDFTPDIKLVYQTFKVVYKE